MELDSKKFVSGSREKTSFEFPGIRAGGRSLWLSGTGSASKGLDYPLVKQEHGIQFCERVIVDL